MTFVSISDKLVNMKEKYVKPVNLKEAVSILRKEKLTIYAGGTTVVPQSGKQKPRGILSLGSLPLNYVKLTKTQLSIGATAKISQIIETPGIEKFADGLIYKTCKQIGSTLLRNLITAGGNIIQIYKWSDLPVSLLVLDTKIEIYNGKKRTVDIKKFLEKHPRTYLKPWEIVTEIKVKAPSPKARCEFIKYSRTHFDYSIFDIAVLVELDNKNRFKDIRISYGGVMPLPFRATPVEKFLKGKEAIEENLEKVKEIIKKEIKFAGDFRVSKNYKQEVLGVYTVRAISSALTRIKR